jgi:hypothetical protein
MAELVYDGDVMASIGFLGDRNLTDYVEAVVFDPYDGTEMYKIVAEGNLVPESRNINYRVTVSAYDWWSGGMERTTINLDWDLANTSGNNNLSVRARNNWMNESFSMFLGMVDGRSVGMNFDVDMYWSTERVRLLFEPLSGRITLPSNSVNVRNVNIFEFMSDIENLMGAFMFY